MKNLILIVIAGLLCCKCFNKTKSRNIVQENKTIKNYQPLKYFNGDSLKYLNQNFVNERSEFSGKTLNIFLDKLEISPKKFLVAIGGSPYTNYIAISIKFLKDIQVNKKIESKQNPMIMNLYFETPVSSEKMDKLLTETKGNWDQKVVRKYLGEEKIKKIALVDYGF